LHRRDFTINTLALCLNSDRYGELFDFYGGEADLRRGLIRVLHSLSFIEDPTRMLRAARLEQRLGFRIEDRTEELIRGALDLLSRTTAERIRHELYLILAEEEPERALHRLDELGVLGRIEPALSTDEWFMEHARLLRQAVKREQFQPAETPLKEDDSDTFQLDALSLPGLYVALLTYRLSAEDLKSFLKRLRILREDATVACQLNALKTSLPQLSMDRLKNSTVYAILHDFDEPALFVLYVACDSWLVRKRIELYQRRLKDAAPLVDGHALKAIGIPPGPVYRQIMERLRTAWLDGEVSDESGESALLEQLLDEFHRQGSI